MCESADEAVVTFLYARVPIEDKVVVVVAMPQQAIIPHFWGTMLDTSGVHVCLMVESGKGTQNAQQSYQAGDLLLV